MNFLKTYPSAVESSTCKELIELFEDDRNKHLINQGSVYGINSEAVVNHSVKKSLELGIDSSMLDNPLWANPVRKVADCIDNCIQEYKKEFYFIDKTGKPWNMDNGINFQRYLPGEGFYDWHCESEGMSNRMLVFMVYLNTIKEGGGTEFNYDIPNLSANEGDVAVWPAYWTHFHRGIVAPKETKYILTGWYSYVG